MKIFLILKFFRQNCEKKIGENFFRISLVFTDFVQSVNPFNHKFQILWECHKMGKISCLVSKSHSKKSFQIFVAFSEYLNFKTYYQLQAKMKVWFIGPSSEPNIIISTILHPSLCISNGNLNLMNYYQFTRCGKSRWEFRDFEMSNHWLCFDNLIRRL